MQKQTIARKALGTSIFAGLMYAVIQLTMYAGVEEKPFYVIAWELIAGGSLGATLGILFF